MQTISINFVVPQGWHELSDKQLRYAYSLIASDFATDEIKTLCLLQWSGTKVIGQQASGSYLLKKGKSFRGYAAHTRRAAAASRLARCAADRPGAYLENKPRPCSPGGLLRSTFETYIIVDNLYQGYLQTQSDDLLDELANVLYGKPIKLKPYERINIFYWVASLKDFFARRYPDFLQPVSAATGGNLLGLLFLNLVFDIIHHVVEVGSFFCVYVYLAFLIAIFH